MAESLAEQQGWNEPRTQTNSVTQEAVEQQSDRRNPTDERESSQVQQQGESMITMSEEVQIQPKKGGKRKAKMRHVGQSSDSAPPGKRPKQAVEQPGAFATEVAEHGIRIKIRRTTVAQPGAITIAEVTENSIRTTWTEAAGAKDSYIISISPDTGVTDSAVSVNTGDTLEHTFTGLTAGTEYTISVVTVSGGENSDPTTKVLRTTVAQPGAITIAEVTENSIRTTWKEAAGAKDSYIISIRPDTDVIDSAGNVNTGNPLEHTFTGLTAGTEYTISVVTVSGGENSDPTTKTQRTTVAQPGAITIAEMTENSIRTTWTEAAGANDRYSISINPDTGVTDSTGSVNTGDPLEHTFTGLTAGTEYTISVVTVSGGENSDPTTKVQKTTVAQPGAITIAEVTENSIRTTWTEAAGTKDSYIISISPDTGVTDSTGSVNTGDTLEHTFTGLTTGTAYTISVVTVSGGKSSDPTTKVLRTTVAQPGAITIAEVTENNIRATWTEAAGTKDSYSISISPDTGVIDSTGSVNTEDTLEHTFTGLTAGTEYTISVVTVSGGENSDPTTKVQRTTVAQPGAITIAEVTENNIRTTWTEAAGAKDSYIISISPDTGVTDSAVSVNTGDTLEHTFTTLTGGTEYTISVVTVSGGVNSVARTETQRTTVAQPGAITIAEVTENSIRATWTEAAGTKDRYSISISPDTGVTDSAVSVNTGDPLEHTFTGLTAGTEYTVSVVTVSGGENSDPTTKVQRTTVAQPGAITIAEVTENSIRTTWTESAGTNDSYSISINPDTGVTDSTGSVNTGDTLEHTFTGLTAGTEYTISVVTVSGGENSDPTTKVLRTTVAQPGAITIAKVTENNIRATWKEAAGAKDSYSISISPDTGVIDSTGSVNTGDILEHAFTGLTAGTVYTISVVTVSGVVNSVARTKTQRTEVTSVLLVNDEYGKAHGGTSTTNRQVAQFLKLHGATVHATALHASEEDKRCASEDGVILHLPVKKNRDKRRPSLEWLNFDHNSRYPDIPQDLKCIVGHADVTSGAAKSIQEDRCQHAKLVLFNHDMPEDTERYRGTQKTIAAKKKMEDILEDCKNADAVFSLGRRIYNYFETKYKSLMESKPREHFLFLPKPSPVFEDISVRPGRGGENVVLTVGKVTEVEKLKGHDLVAQALGEVAEKITNVRLLVRGIDEDDWEASKRILEENLHSGKIKPTLLPCGTQEDIAWDMQQAHLVLMPSRAEPFGLIGLEAIAAGIPVLISDKSGLADMITDLIEEEKCPADMRHRIVETSVNESDRDVAAKEWAKRIVDTLKHSKHEFDRAAEYKKKLLESRYWEESQENLLRVCGLID